MFDVLLVKDTEMFAFRESGNKKLIISLGSVLTSDKLLEEPSGPQFYVNTSSHEAKPQLDTFRKSAGAQPVKKQGACIYQI